MIRLKLFIGLFSAVLVLAVAGAFGLRMLKFRIDGYEQTLDRKFAAIQALHDVQKIIQTLNAHYLPLFADRTDYSDIGSEVLESKLAEMQGLISGLRTDPPLKGLEEDGIEKIRNEISSYAEVVRELLDQDNANQISRSRRDILAGASRVFEASESIVESLEGYLVSEHGSLKESSSRTLVILSVISGVCVLLTFFAYHFLTKGILEPVVYLTESIRQVQNRNLDLSVPVKSRDELGDLNDAFNVMAAELRVLSLEHDEKIKKIDAENQAIIGNFPHPIAFLDSGGKVIKINPKAEELFSELKLVDGLPRRIRSIVDRCIEKNEEHLPQELFHSVLLRVDERELFFLPRVFEIHGEAGFDGWALVLTDVTKLRWIDDIKNNFLSTVSHEIRTPLTSVRMILHLLSEEKVGELDKKQMEMVVSAKNETERLIESAARLLSTSRIEAGDEYLETKSVGPSDLIETAVKNFTGNEKGDPAKIEVDCGKNLPLVNVDANSINLVFQNYLSNAVRYAPEGSAVKVGARTLSDKFIRFSVIDFGEGIPAELEESVFEKFVKGANDRGAGVGLGLSISREIVHAHGGRIGLGKEDNCTEFYFDLPVSS